MDKIQEVHRSKSQNGYGRNKNKVYANIVKLYLPERKKQTLSMFSSVTYKVSGSPSVYSVAMFLKLSPNYSFLLATQILVIKKCQ